MALDDKFIIRRIQNHIQHGVNGEYGDVTDVRQDMFALYNGDMLGNEREGYSQIRTREVLECLEWALCALLRIFLGGAKAVEFSPLNAQDVQQAKLETDAVNYWFFNGNPNASGFITLYTLLKDTLMYPNAYGTVDVEEEQTTDVEQLSGVPEAQLHELDGDEEASYDITRSYDEEVAPGEKIALYDVSISRDVWSKRVVVTARPPDQVIVAHTHYSLDLDGSPFVCVRSQQSRSDLRKLGYEEDVLEDLGPGESDKLWNDEEITRHFYADEDPSTEDDEFSLPADEMFWVHECYMMIDDNEDGINELRKIVMAGCRIIANEEIDYNPAFSATAIVNTHKHIGLSYAEIVADLQELMTQLTRQMLDNIYKQNVQRTFISESAVLSDNSTMDQLLDGTTEYVTVRGDPHTSVMAEQTTPIVTEIGAVMEQFRNKPQLRTGVAPELTLDPSVLEKATLGAFMGALEQASQRLELLARLFAETTFKKIFQKIHYCLRTFFDKPFDMPINGTSEFVTVDPRKWKARPNMTVNVGLGFNNKQMMLGMLTQLLTIQKEAMQIGLSDAKTIYSTLEKLIEQANMGHAQSYFLDPKQQGWKPPVPQPDAAMIQAQAQAAALKAEAERKGAELKEKIQLDKAEQARKQQETNAKISNDTESANVRGAELSQALIEFKTDKALKDAQIAMIMAQITALNRGDKNQSGPAEDSSADEFTAAKAKTREAV